MSYNCDICGLSSSDCEVLTKQVVLTRNKNYYTLALCKVVKKRQFKGLPDKLAYKFFHQRVDKDTLTLLKKEGWRIISETRTNGKEIVKEDKLCLNCKEIVKQK